MEIADIREKVTPVLREHGVLKASLFGSVSRGDDKPESDIDLLVELGKPMGMIAFVHLSRQMENILGRKVDMVTMKSLNKFVKPFVLPELKTIYEG